jgi:UDP-N-acetylmuramoylalanine--D-glutamate ligase
MRLADLRGRRVAVLGGGRDTTAALPALLGAAPAELCLVEDSGAPDEPWAAVPRVPLADAAAGADVLVRSPGFPRYRPELVAARDRGASMTTPLDLWWCTHAGDHTTVGVTGTKGKSTTTSLIAHLAAQAGLSLGMAGNIGIPVFSDDWDHDAERLVFEVSNFQASDLHAVPTIAVLASLAEDHLDWHGDVERYHADKLRVLRNEAGTAAHVVLPAGDARAVAATRDLASELHLVPAPPSVEGVPDQRLRNAALAARVVTLLGAAEPDAATVVDAARRSLPGRLDILGEHQGVLWVDDALASNPHSCAAGLGWARSQRRPTVVLVGGADRGVDPTPIADEVAQWPAGTLAAITLPDTGDALAARCGIQVIATATTVSAAALLASQLVQAGSIVMLCPGNPTPASVGDWRTRSEELRAAVARIAGSPG